MKSIFAILILLISVGLTAQQSNRRLLMNVPAAAAAGSCGGGGDTPAFVQSEQNDGGTATSSAKAFAGNTVSGNTCLVGVRVGATGRTVTVTDTQGTTYIQDANKIQTTDGHEIFVFHGSGLQSAANTVTASISGGAVSLRHVQVEASGICLTSPKDQSSTAQGDGVTTLNSGNITTTQNKEYFFAFAGNSAAKTWSAGANYTLRQAVPPNAGTQRAAAEDRVVTSTGTYSADIASDTSANISLILVSYKGK